MGSGTTRDRRLGQKEPFEPKKNFGLCGHWRPLEGPGEARHCQGPSGTTRDRHFGQKKPFEQKKNFGLCGLEAAGGSRGGPTLSGTTRDRRLGQKEPFEPKKKFGLCGLCGHWRPLEGPREARHCQEPSGT